jgi:hypothetical protein
MDTVTLRSRRRASDRLHLAHPSFSLIPSDLSVSPHLPSLPSPIAFTFSKMLAQSRFTHQAAQAHVRNDINEHSPPSVERPPKKRARKSGEGGATDKHGNRRKTSLKGFVDLPLDILDMVRSGAIGLYA